MYCLQTHECTHMFSVIIGSFHNVPVLNKRDLFICTLKRFLLAVYGVLFMLVIKTPRRASSGRDGGQNSFLVLLYSKVHVKLTRGCSSLKVKLINSHN